MKNQFSKRVFTPSVLASHLTELVKIAPSLPETLRKDRVSPAFRERILLAVTSVNRCRYCQWMHTDLAQASGIGEEQIQMLLGSNVEKIPEFEQPALQYALHYAQTDRNPDEQQRAALFDFYGEGRARDIENYIKLIFFANLSGNTFDSFLSRLRGEPHPKGNVLFELVFSVFSGPVLLAIALGTKNAVNPLSSLAHS